MSHRQKLQRKFAKLKKEYLAEHPYCEISLLLGVEVPANVVHHIKGKVGEELYLDKKYFIALCTRMHLILHREDGTWEEYEYVKKLLSKVLERRG